jgi:hypothetical protein
VGPPNQKPLILKVSGFFALVIASLLQAIRSDIWLDK